MPDGQRQRRQDRPRGPSRSKLDVEADSLAELWKEHRRHDARRAIEEVLDLFVDGYPTSDMRAARGLLQEPR